jgi:hypothetical protein
LVGGYAEYHCGGVNEMMDECWGHDLNDFGYWHPIIDFAGKPSVVLGVPHIVAYRIPSNDLQPFYIGYQHGFIILGHLVLGSYPGHGHAFLA